MIIKIYEYIKGLIKRNLWFFISLFTLKVENFDAKITTLAILKKIANKIKKIYPLFFFIKKFLNL